MVDLRLTPLSQVGQVTIDSLVDFAELDRGTYVTILLYADRDRVDDIIHQSEVHNKEWRRYASDALMDLADGIRRQLPLHRQGAITYTGYLYHLFTMTQYAQVLSEWALVDLVDGGAMKDFRPKSRIRSDGELTPRVRRWLYSAAWIRRYVKCSVDCQKLRHVSDRMSTHTREWVTTLQEDLEVLERDVSFQNSLIPVEETVFQRYNESRSHRKRRIKVVKRSMRFASMLLGPEKVRAFVRGEPVLLLGNHIDLEVTRAFSIFVSGHGSCSISVKDKEGAHLADLCLYFKGTPAIDQLAALELHMRSGDEELLLRDANIIRVSSEATNHSILVRRPHENSPQRRRDLINRYWDETRPIWMKEVFIYSLGGKLAKHFFDSIESDDPLISCESARLDYALGSG